MKIKILINFAILCFLGVVAVAQPTDNPYATKYGLLYGHWTDSLPWSRIFDISTYAAGRTDWDNVYLEAKDSVTAKGGGVIYFPAGTYRFNNSIELRSGVIIRGATPAVLDAKDSMFNPETYFEFPEYVPDFNGTGTPNSSAFKTIYSAPNTSNVALVYLNINHARISIRSSTFIQVSTPRGTTGRSIENNRNAMVFGIRQNNAASPEASVPSASQNQWQRYCNRFAANVSLYMAENGIIANCRLNDFEKNGANKIRNASYRQPGYLADSAGRMVVMDSNLAWFNYTDHYVISMNRKATITYGTPDIEPGAFCRGLEIVDNWMYRSMRVAIYASGLGIKINGNIIKDQPGKVTRITPSGTQYQRNQSATYENRGIDWAGWQVEIKNNDVETFRHRFAGSPYLSVDGEGILLQECCGGTSVNGFNITGNTVNSYIGLYKPRDVNNGKINSNDMRGTYIEIEANTNNNTYTVSNAVIDSNFNVSNIIMLGTKGGVASFIRDNVGTGQIRRTCHVVEQNNTGFTINQCVPIVATGVVPEITLLEPLRDTTITQPFQTVTLSSLVVSGTPDSVHFLSGTEVIGRFAAATLNTMTYTLPAVNKTHYFTAYAFDATGNFAYTDPKAVRVCVNCNTTSISKEVQTSKVQLYPHPVDGVTKIDLGSTFSGRKILQIYDLRGKVCQSALLEFVEGITHTTISLPPGMYLLNVSGEKLPLKFAVK